MKCEYCNKTIITGDIVHEIPVKYYDESNGLIYDYDEMTILCDKCYAQNF